MERGKLKKDGEAEWFHREIIVIGLHEEQRGPGVCILAHKNHKIKSCQKMGCDRGYMLRTTCALVMKLMVTDLE